MLLIWIKILICLVYYVCAWLLEIDSLIKKLLCVLAFIHQRQYLKINHFYINSYVYICSFHYKCLIVFNLYYRLLVWLQHTTPVGMFRRSPDACWPCPCYRQITSGRVRGPAPKGSRQLSADECIWLCQGHLDHKRHVGSDRLECVWTASMYQ